MAFPDQLNERDEVFGLERLKDAFLGGFWREARGAIVISDPQNRAVAWSSMPSMTRHDASGLKP